MKNNPGLRAARAAMHQKEAPHQPDPQKALEYALSEIKTTIENFTEIKASFIAKLNKEWSASRVIHWQAENVTMAEFECVIYAELLEAWEKLSKAEQTPEKMLEFVKEVAVRLTYDLMNNRFRCGSTSSWANAEEMAKQEAAARLHRKVSFLILQLERELAPSQKGA